MDSESKSPPDTAMFVAAALDDYGLSQAQFRVFGHVSRRVNCYASLRNMAKTCQMHRDTVIDCLRFLVDRKLLSVLRSPGRPSTYRQNSPAEWLPAGNKGAPEIKGHPSKPGIACPERRGTHLAETKGHKGSPIKGSPLKAFNGKCAGAAEQENEMMSRAMKVFGKRSMEASGGMYRTLLRQNRRKFERVLAEVDCQVREGKQLDNPGGYFMDTWKRFAD
jgi:hypothetical protein